LHQTFFISELLKKSGARDKYHLTKLAIQRIKQLVREREKRALLISDEKLTTYVLREFEEGEVKAEDFKELGSQEKDNEEFKSE